MNDLKSEIKEGRNAVTRTRLSCRSFDADAVRLSASRAGRACRSPKFCGASPPFVACARTGDTENATSRKIETSCRQQILKTAAGLD
jgi:hypothetical protein